MLVFKRLIVYLVVFALIAPGCATKKPISISPPLSKREVYLREQYEAERLREDEKYKQDQVDKDLRVASIALDMKDVELAHATLENCVDWMGANSSDADFKKRHDRAMRVMGGKEEGKYYLGDPYEQSMAAIYLGILDFQLGRYEDAAQMFRYATYFDTGSSFDAYKTDCYLAFLLEGIATRALGRDASDAFRQAELAHGFRTRLPIVQEAIYFAVAEFLNKHPDKDAGDKIDALFPVMYSQLLLKAYDSNDILDAINQSVDSTLQAATATIEEDDATKADDELRDAQKQVSKEYGGATSPKIAEHLNELAATAKAYITPEMLANVQAAQAEFVALIARCQDPATNAFFLVQKGQAPAKVREGKYGEVVQFRPYPCPAQRMLATVAPSGTPAGAGQMSMAILGESIDYQAMTRGGREVDHLLKGRAQFRDAMKVSSFIGGVAAYAAYYAAIFAATSMVTTTTVAVTPTITASGTVGMTTTTTTSTAPAGMAAAGPAIAFLAVAVLIWQGSKILADATHPEADVRGWHELPSKIFLTCGSLPPGEYNLRSDYFDVLARPLPTEAETSTVTIEADRPNIILTGSIYSAPAQPQTQLAATK